MKNIILDWVKTFIIALAIAYIVNSFVIVNAIVPTGSMEPSISPGDRLFAFRLSYTFSDPERGDVVVFDSNHEEKLLVKRVIGLPGETLEIKDGLIYINGLVLEDDFTEEVTLGHFGPFVVPEGEYFMMGDNRDNSHDSRFWVNPYIEQKNIKGKIIVRYFPLPKLY